MKRWRDVRQAAIPRVPWFHSHPVWAAAVVVALFGLVFATRVSAGDAPADAVSMLYALPVALAATTFGRSGGLAAGLVAIGLFVVWAVRHGVDLTWLGWAARIVPLLMLGFLLGDASERLLAAEGSRRELEGAAQRHRDAAEISDSLIQGMTAARWALEAERYDVALETLEDTIVKGQRLVSDLLRDADLAPGQ